MKPFERERIERAEHPLSLISLLISTPIRQHFENTNTFHFNTILFCYVSLLIVNHLATLLIDPQILNDIIFLSNAGCANVFVYPHEGSTILGGTEPDKF